MLLVLIMSLLVLYILEYIIPYSKNVKWIENSSNAFYQSESSIEEWLKYLKERDEDIENSVSWVDLRKEKSTIFISNKIGSKFDTTSSGTIIPPVWEWNSSYSWSFNKISFWEPIQIEVWNGMVDFSNIKFSFQIPKALNKDNKDLDWWTWAIISWQLSSSNDTLNANKSWILADDITSTWIDYEIFDWNDKNWDNIEYDKWIKLDWNDEDIGMFYTSNCYDAGSWCILKMFIVNDLILTDWNSLPYLEYKIDFSSWLQFWVTNIPLRYSRIKSTWKSYGFQKELEVRVPQQTTNDVFNFTIFQ